ncbi:hypothetical protein [Bacillus thuringiensis]|uniref:hypothetical protein n=1 Tax=Bacillus thuringiensis TaxID=1428 RepID=UPI000BFEA77C|nr:hypothetical protein [Bacillus thuringiensis]PGT90003.1 hypothetical protein COD17_09645 [Bacillus thuringiensis]
MAIQITLDAKEFAHKGLHNGRKYDQLRVKSASNGRIYFSTVKEGMRMSTMAKQMQLEEGKVYVSFGKAGKLVIGTYKEVQDNQ